MNEFASLLSWVGVGLVALIPVINPVSTAVLLLSISTQHSRKERNHQITMACLLMVVILVTFLIAGHFIMVAFGISIPGVRIAGGMVIGFLGFKMLFPGEKKSLQENRHESQPKQNIPFMPMAMTNLSGPGAIAVVITMSSSIDGKEGIDKIFAFSGVITAIVIAALISWTILRGAVFFRRYLGTNGVDSLSSIMGFLLVCIGIQFAINGVRDLVMNVGM
jgi:multiple antibiotic resistance protein